MKKLFSYSKDKISDNAIIEIQKTIEETRLSFAKKFENFLLKKINFFKKVVKEFLATNEFLIFASIAIIMTSLLARSSRDIGEISLFNAKKLGFSIIQAEIWVNLFGIFAVFLSYLILKRSKIYHQKIVFNLLILSFVSGFFIRVFTLQYNEFFTLSSLFLSASYLYFSYLILGKESFRILDKIFFLTLNLLLLCLIFLMPISDFRNGFSILKEDLFPIFLVVFLSRKLVIKYDFFKPCFLLILIAAIVSSANFDQRFLLYSMSLPMLFLLVYFWLEKINSEQISLEKLFFISSILLVLQFDLEIFPVIFNLCLLWWVLLPFFYHHLNKVLTFILLIFATLTSVMIFYPNYENLAWILSLIMFALICDFASVKQKESRLSNLSSYVFFVLISYFLSQNLTAIFNYQNSVAAKYKSPNFLSDEIAKTIKKYNQNQGLISIQSKQSFPMLAYLKQENSAIDNPKNHLIFIEKSKDDLCQIGILEKKFSELEFYQNFSENYIFLNRIIETENVTDKVQFFHQELDHSLQDNQRKIIKNEFEIYIRKN